MPIQRVLLTMIKVRGTLMWQYLVKNKLNY